MDGLPQLSEYIIKVSPGYVGQSGLAVSPRLYFACGISGAILHIVGKSSVVTIVPINKDQNVQILDLSDLGLRSFLYM